MVPPGYHTRVQGWRHRTTAPLNPFYEEARASISIPTPFKGPTRGTATRRFTGCPTAVLGVAGIVVDWLRLLPTTA